MRFIFTLVIVAMFSVGAVGQQPKGRAKCLEIEIYTADVENFRRNAKANGLTDYADIKINIDHVVYKMTLEEFKRRIAVKEFELGILLVGQQKAEVGVVKRAHAQQKAVIETPATTTYALNAESSAIYTKLEEARVETLRQLNVIQSQQYVMMVTAGIPASERDRQPALGKDGIVSFIPKAPKPDVPKP